jgi:hypothetical protein
MECPNIQKLDAAVDYMPYKGYKPLYEYKFYGECNAIGFNIGCFGQKCSKCSFYGTNGCLKDKVFIDKSYRQNNSCRCFSDKLFSGHMDWSRLGKKKDMF